jgi:hypothetical protein
MGFRFFWGGSKQRMAEVDEPAPVGGLDVQREIRVESFRNGSLEFAFYRRTGGQRDVARCYRVKHIAEDILEQGLLAFAFIWSWSHSSVLIVR